MKIKITTPIAGTLFVYRPGDVVEHEEIEARRLVAAGHAHPADKNAPLTYPQKPKTSADAGELETAAGGDVETAEQEKPKKK